jgi:hypothetical protein
MLKETTRETAAQPPLLPAGHHTNGGKGVALGWDYLVGDLIAELKIEPGKDIPPEVPAAVAEMMEELTRVAPSVRHAGKAAKEVQAKLQGTSEWTVKLAEARAVVHETVANAPLSLGTGAVVLSKSSILKEQQALLLTQPLIDDTLQEVGKSVVKKMFDGVGQIDPVSQPNMGKNPQGIPQPPVLPLITPALQFCIPPNPILKALRLHAELNLYKLRTCRNIAGMKRQLDPYAAPTDTTSGMPARRLSLEAGTELPSGAFSSCLMRSHCARSE